MVGKPNTVYEGTLTFTVVVRFGAPNEAEARKRFLDVADVISESKLKPGVIYRNFRPKHMPGMPSIIGRGFRRETLEVIE